LIFSESLEKLIYNVLYAGLRAVRLTPIKEKLMAGETQVELDTILFRHVLATHYTPTARW
jgi:hypothetical protein